MIPTTISGIIVVLTLLIPGFIFVTLRERHQPVRKLSVLRETSTVLVATTAAYAVPVVATLVAAVSSPSVRTNLAAFISSPATFTQQHPFRFIAVAVAYVLVASVIAGTLSAKWMDRFFPDPGGSAWWALFDAKIPGLISTQVSATLTDDTVVTGTLYSWNRDAEDHPDRELVFQAPIWVQLPKSETAYQLEDEATLAISARQLKFLSAKYFVDQQTATEEQKHLSRAVPPWVALSLAGVFAAGAGPWIFTALRPDTLEVLRAPLLATGASFLALAGMTAARSRTDRDLTLNDAATYFAILTAGITPFVTVSLAPSPGSTAGRPDLMVLVVAAILTAGSILVGNSKLGTKVLVKAKAPAQRHKKQSRHDQRP